MNTEKGFWRKYRAYWILLAALAIIALWAYLTMPRTGQGGDGDSVGISGSTAGGGTGSADGGDGTGAGDSGSGTGAGTGENQTSPEAKDSGSAPAVNPSAEQGTEAEHADGTAGSGDPLTKELPKVSLVQPLEEVVPVAPKEETPSGGKAAGRRGFYGIDVKRDGKVLFLVDNSGSMGAATLEYAGKTKFDVLKLELVKSICGGPVPKATTYQRMGGFIITRFAGMAYSEPQKGIWRYRNREDVKAALASIDSMPMDGGTNMIPAWSEALDRIAKDNIDTVYFLTDGEPTDDFNEVIFEDMLKRRNIKKSLIIHCIAIGHDQEFMKKIAEKHKGKYVYLP